MSSGEIQLLTLSLDLLLACEMWRLEGKKGTLLVDEPNNHLHPDMQQVHKILNQFESRDLDTRHLNKIKLKGEFVCAIF